MDANAALEHAKAVAREVVRAGLCDTGRARQHLAEYAEFVRAQGVRGTYTQLLFARGVLDRARFAEVQARVPPPALANATQASVVLRLPAGVVPPAGPASRGEGTESFDRVLPAPPAPDPLDALATIVDLGASDGDEGPGAPQADPGDALPTLLDHRGGDGDDDPLGAGLGSSDELALPSAAELARGRAGAPRGPLPLASSAGDYDPTWTGEAPRILTTADSGGSAGSRPDATPWEAAGRPGSGAPIASPPAADAPRGLAAGQDVPDDVLGSAELEAPAEPRPGESVGGPELPKLIGRGGMGLIYRARARDGQTVALKLLAGGRDPGADRRRQRFRCEFEALRRLDHPGIVRVFDFGRDGPWDWYSMELVDGKDLERLLAQGALEPAARLDRYADIVDAIAHAHARQVVHRDLKPQNVVVDAAGRARVLDFGLAKILDQGLGMTRTGSSLGTPFYMAPEQLQSAKQVDARADVFALGVILYELLTGQRPFLGASAAEVGQHILHHEPPRPGRVAAGVHPDLDALCMRALEKDPAARYPDAGALLADLARHRAGSGVAGASGLGRTTADLRRFARRHKAPILAAAVTATVCLGLVAAAAALLLSR